MPRALDLGAKLVATGLGSGYSKIAPGTAGSLVGLVLFLPLAGRSWPVQLAATAVVTIVGALAADRVAKLLGRKDPGLVVVDDPGRDPGLARLPRLEVVGGMDAAGGQRREEAGRRVDDLDRDVVAGDEPAEPLGDAL